MCSPELVIALSHASNAPYAGGNLAYSMTDTQKELSKVLSDVKSWKIHIHIVREDQITLGSTKCLRSTNYSEALVPVSKPSQSNEYTLCFCFS